MYYSSMSRSCFICFKQFPLNSTAIFALRIKVNLRARLLSDVTGGLMLSSDNPLDFHAKILSLPVGAVKDLRRG